MNDRPLWPLTVTDMTSWWNFQRRSLAARLAIGFGVVLALVLAIALIGAYTIHGNNELQRRTVAALQVQQQVRSLALEVATDEVRTLAVSRSAGMPEVLDPFRPQMAESRQRVEKLLLGLAEVDTSLLPAERTARIAEAYTRYLQGRDQVVQLVDTGRTIQATAAIDQTLTPAQAAWGQAITALNQAMDEQARLIAQDAERRGTQATMAILLMAVMALLLGAMWARLISRSIARPIAAAVQQSTAIAHGDLRRQASVNGSSHDEGGEPGQLLGALSTMRQSLLDMSVHTAQSAERVASAAEVMSLSAQSLAIRTDEQTQGVSAARERVAKVAQQIRQTAEQAAEGESQCNHLQSAAKTGQDASQLAVDTMQRIAQRSGDMSEVVNLIQSIAFQINLLSLNAAIEAARAGKAGAGFAVVAGEVRRLAGRASESAASIRVLIQGTTEQLASGVTCVHQVATQLGQMNGLIEQVAERARDIREATVHQTDALGAASDDLVELVRLNTANTDMVISTVHGCESLRGDADDLLSRIARMQLDEADPAPASVTAPSSALPRLTAHHEN